MGEGGAWEQLVVELWDAGAVIWCTNAFHRREESTTGMTGERDKNSLTAPPRLTQALPHNWKGNN